MACLLSWALLLFDKARLKHHAHDAAAARSSTVFTEKLVDLALPTFRETQLTLHGAFQTLPG